MMIRSAILAAVCLAVALGVQRNTVQADDALANQVAGFEQTIAQLKADESAAKAAVVDATTQVQTLEQQKLRAERQEQNATTSNAELAKQKPDKEAAAVKAQQARTVAAEAVAAAETEQAAIKDKADATDEQKQQAETRTTEAKKKLGEAEQALKGPADELLKLLESTAANSKTIEQAQADVKRLTGEVDAAKQHLQTKTDASASVTAKRIEQEHALQNTLVAANRWVSFAGEVAPIFQQRCIACHNARTAKGRLNLESYATLRQGGESGECVVPGKPADSMLCTVVADGSMPAEADPLAPEQIATLQRWVEFGGRLDAGVDAHARLMQIMPRRAQPTPPEHYPAPLPVTTVAFSPDGSLLATSGYHEVLVWTVADGKLQRRIPNVAASVYAIAFHPDGQRLAVAAGTPSETGEVKVFRVADGELLADLVRVDDVMLGVSFSPDGSKLAASGADRSIRVFDASTYAPVFSVEDHADWVLAIGWSPDGTRLVSASRDKTSKIFDAATGDALGTFNGHGEIVYDVAISADGKQAVTCGADNLVRIWNVADSKEVRKLDGAGGDVLQLALLADGRLASGGEDKTPRLHQTADGKLLHALSPQADWVYALDAHAATGLVAAGGADGQVRLWKLETGEAVRDWAAAP